MTEVPIPSKETERRGQLETLLKNSTHRIILSYIVIQRLRELGAPAIFIQNSEEQITKRAGRLSYISSEINKNPDDVLTDTIERVLNGIREGVFSYGPYISYSREDEPVIRELLDEIKTGRRKLHPFTEEDKVRTENVIKETTERNVEAPSLVDKFLLDGEWRETNKWYELKPQEEEEESIWNRVSITIPLVGGRTITIQLSKFDPSLFPREDGLLDQTFPVTHAVFHYTEPRKKDSLTRRIKCVERTEDIAEKLGTLEEALVSGSEDEIGMELRKKMARVLRLGKIDPSSFRRFAPVLTVSEIIEDLTDFIHSNSTGENLDRKGNEMDLELLIDQFLKHGSFPGNCRSISTLVVGFAKFIGLKGRIVNGSFQDLEDNNSGGHMWAEIYIPKIKNWVPADASLDTTLVYPSTSEIYFLNSELVTPIKESLRIKVTYS